MRPATPLAVENGVGKLAAKVRQMSARERECGELPSPICPCLTVRSGRDFLFFEKEDGGALAKTVPPAARPVRLEFRRRHAQTRAAQMITYRIGNDLDLEQVLELYRASTLGERRPIGDRERFAAMIRNANLVITAWEGELLVGISRCLTDLSYITYLADLAVRVSHQKRGIGRELIRQTQLHGGPKTSLVLLAAPAAEKYYPHIGFSHMPQAWMMKAG
jgi:predicted N-acetyltransferase YhbS